ncbi:MAG: carotenoid biosynthesis protein [Flammeovirgaceae bacterium]|nr:carotenoid biosynthesis protein [Flammeovirgaceae bacterium]
MFDGKINITSFKKMGYLNPNLGNTFRNYFNLRRSTLLIILIHSVGVLGILSPLQSIVLPLTPFSILISFLLFINHYSELKKRMVGFIIFVILLGFLIEFFGVKTGFPFGDYTYGKTLGLSLWNIPLIIGINWAMLVLGFCNVLSGLKMNNFVKSFLGASLMVGIDFLIEPVAIQCDFWGWAGDEIPIENYLGWFFVSFLFFAIYYYKIRSPKNQLGIVLIAVQVSFFLLLNIALIVSHLTNMEFSGL